MKKPNDGNGTSIKIEIHISRSFIKFFTTTYLPTFCLLILVQLTFYFPEDNFQIRGTVTLRYKIMFYETSKILKKAIFSSCLLILSTLFISTSNSLPTTTKFTMLEQWMIFAVIFTFAVTILQTIYGYCMEKENLYHASIQKVAPLKGSFNNQPKMKKPWNSRKINNILGKIVCPIIFMIFTLLYGAVALFISLLQ